MQWLASAASLESVGARAICLVAGTVFSALLCIYLSIFPYKHGQGFQANQDGGVHDMLQRTSPGSVTGQLLPDAGVVTHGRRPQ